MKKAHELELTPLDRRIPKKGGERGESTNDCFHISMGFFVSHLHTALSSALYSPNEYTSL